MVEHCFKELRDNKNRFFHGYQPNQNPFSMANLIGQYQLTNTTLLKAGTPSLKLVIASRKKPTPQKPKFYLLLALPAGGYQYVSSLYPAPEWPQNGPQVYSLDWSGQVYTLEIRADQGQASISSTPLPDPTGSINNVGLGAKFTPHAGI